MEPDLVSVMMPAFNAERFIRQAIESLLAQSYSKWELLIVNDGSTDETANAARGFGDPRIRVIDQPNSGEAVARNTALKHMNGEYVAFLDADDLFHSDHLASTVGLLQHSPGYDAVYTDGYYCDETARRLQSLSSRRLPPAVGNIFDQVVRASCMLGPPLCVVLRRNVVTRHDLCFDASLVIGPDWDFFIRFAEVGRFKYLDRRTCLYRLHSNNISSSAGETRRTADLARCRMKAIQLKSFSACSVQTRVAVFYELLVRFLLGRAGDQTAVTGSEEFVSLPAAEQARLLRLMASKTLAYSGDVRQIAEWLQRSRALNPSDFRALCLAVLHSASPRFCRFLLRFRLARQEDPRSITPFADVRKGVRAA